MSQTGGAGAARSQLPRSFLWSGFGLLLSAQLLLGFLGVADMWTRGHNGWNGGAYHLAARNTLRWEVLLPLQYDAGARPPDPSKLYTHHPLALHLHNTASVAVFGDHPAAVRGVAAAHGVLALAMLFVLVRRFWGDLHALLATAIYVVLPINAIYINMANHSSGFIFWSLLALYGYLRYQQAAEHDEPTRWWYAATLGAFFMAAQWDWPAYYVAFGMAVHWLVAGQARLRRLGRPWWRWDGHLLGLVAFSAFVLALFGGHFLLIQWLTGNVGELAGTFEERQNVGWPRFRDHLGVVPEVMFTWPVLGLSAGWLLAYAARLPAGRATARDLVPLVYGLGGAVHYWVFKWSAIVHSYWAWTMLPFVAIACASVIVTMGSTLARWASPRVGRGLGWVAGAAVGLALVPLVVRAADIVPPARRVGGSMWWVAPVRGPVATDYRSGRPELRFAEQVRAWTDRRTGVLVHRSIENLNPEPRFNTHLDRERRDVLSVPSRLPVLEGVDGWVFIGVIGQVPRHRIAALASEHPYWEYDRFFMVDLRRPGPDVQVWSLEPEEPGLAWRYFVSPFEGPVVARRWAALERAMREAFGQVAR
jgi:4-amino-4-deoxy-L-arabinose transferase-like glycosyltransferase